MFTRLKNLFGKAQNTAVAQQAQATLDKAKDAYTDITKDGLGMDDIAKIKDHAQNLAGDVKTMATSVSANAGELIKDVHTMGKEVLKDGKLDMNDLNTVKDAAQEIVGDVKAVVADMSDTKSNAA